MTKPLPSRDFDWRKSMLDVIIALFFVTGFQTIVVPIFKTAV